MTPHGENNCSLLFLPATPLSLKGIFLSPRPSRATNLTSGVTSGTIEIQGHRWVGRGGRREPRTLSKTADTSLDCASVKKYPSLIIALLIKS